MIEFFFFLVLVVIWMDIAGEIQNNICLVKKLVVYYEIFIFYAKKRSCNIKKENNNVLFGECKHVVASYFLRK